MILAAKEEDVADVIRAGGLANIKALRIKETLQKIKTDAGAITLGFLADQDKNKAREYLLSLPGVGPKTAAVVLLFAFRSPIYARGHSCLPCLKTSRHGGRGG